MANKCPAVCPGPSAAKGGPCLLEEGHSGDHETYGILIATMGPKPENNCIIQDGSEHFHWHDDKE